MKLNVREKIMLISLAVFAVIAAFYFFLLLPKFDKIDALYIEEDSVKKQIETIERELAAGANLDADIEQTKSDIEEATMIFYPEILIEKMIVIIDEMVKNVNLKNDSLALNIPTLQNITVFERTAQQESYYIKDILNEYIVPEDANESNDNKQEIIPAEVLSVPEVNKRLEVLAVNLSLYGTYEQIIEFISEIEGLEKTVEVTNLSLSKGTEDQMSATMSIAFYAISKMNNDQDDEYYEWPFDNEYGKDNPFLIS